MTFTNASFETAGTAPGEAADWTWTSVATATGFPTFYTSAAAYASAREGFEAGWRQYPRWWYADAAARVAAGGFAATDVGGVAAQLSDSTLWVLQSDVGPTWTLIETDSIETPEGTPTVRPTFRGSLSGREDFERWQGGSTVADVPDLQSATDTGEGMRGWVDAGAGSAEALRSADAFDEGWCADPWTGVAMVPQIRSGALTFPLTLPPERARLWWWSAAQDRIVEITIVPGPYTTALDLATALNNAWFAAALPAAAIWFPYADADTEGVELRWFAGYGGADVLALAWPALLRNSDARAVIGFPPTQPTLVPTARIDAVPTAFADPLAYVDAAHVIAARSGVASDGGLRVLPPTAAAAPLDGGDREDFDYAEWTGGGVWVPTLSLAAMATPTWTGGGTYEGFENPAVTWPGYYEV